MFIYKTTSSYIWAPAVAFKYNNTVWSQDTSNISWTFYSHWKLDLNTLQTYKWATKTLEHVFVFPLLHILFLSVGVT